MSNLATDLPLDAEASVDVLVIGAGGCGLTAALAAAAGGAEVAVVEKAARAGGNTAVSSGSIPAAGTPLQARTGIEDSPARFAADLAHVAGRHEAMEISDTLVERSAELIGFLTDTAGVTLTLIETYRHVGHSVHRLHAPPSRKGIDLMVDLLRACEARGIPLAFGQPARGLIVAGDRVCGAVIDDGAGGTYRIAAGSVILATNGFGASPRLLAEHCPLARTAYYAGSPHSEGEALDWGLPLGAKTGNMPAFQGHAGIDTRTGGLLTWTVIERGGFIVDGWGRRIMDESIGYSAAAAVLLAAGGPFFMVYDARIEADVAAGQPEFAEAVAAGAARKADSAAELAQRTGAEAHTLDAALDGAARAARGEGGDPFGRTAWGLGALDTGALRFSEIRPALFHTQGGLMVDHEARVLRADGSVIEGLFAGGGAAAGISGADGAGGYMSGNGLLSALGLGMIAGKCAARVKAFN